MDKPKREEFRFEFYDETYWKQYSESLEHYINYLESKNKKLSPDEIVDNYSDVMERNDIERILYTKS